MVKNELAIVPAIGLWPLQSSSQCRAVMLWRGEEKGETQRKENVFGNISSSTPLLYSDHRRAFFNLFLQVTMSKDSKI